MTALKNRRCSILLGLAAAASLLELGPIVFELQRGAGLLAILLAGLAYQVGNFVPRLFVIRSGWLAGSAAVFGSFGLVTAPAGTPAWLATIALLSWTLQSVRRSVKAQDGGDLPTTVEKRTARVIGFVAASLLPPIIMLAIVIGLLAAALPEMPKIQWSLPRSRRRVWHPLEWTMLVHQTHYFAYAYAVPLLVATTTLGGTHLVGFWFACGWVTYLSAEAIWRRCPPQFAFISGHLLLAAVLLLLSWFGNAPLAAATFWILSGFGGGTVYCLPLLHDQAGLSHEQLEGTEDVGHLLGIAVAIVGVLTVDWTEGTLPAVGAGFAVVAATMMIAMVLHSRSSSIRIEKPRR
ncbi:MAG: hypothetical protein WBO29_05305 [Albidovulum sp.]